MSEMPQHDTVPEWTLGWRLRRALDHAGISVEAMARELGYERKALSRWMHDQNAPRPPVIAQWALRCGVSARWLRSGDGGPGDGPGILAGEGYEADGSSVNETELMQYTSRRLSLVAAA